MTKDRKHLAAVCGVVFLAILLLLFFRRGGGAAAGTTIVNGAPFSMPAVTGPDLGPVYYGDEPWTINIPGLDLSGPDLSMIGACCSDCMQSNQQFYQPQYDNTGNTYVFNAGDSGPNIYNYSTPFVTQQTPGVCYAGQDCGVVGMGG